MYQLYNSYDDGDYLLLDTPEHFTNNKQLISNNQYSRLHYTAGGSLYHSGTNVRHNCPYPSDQVTSNLIEPFYTTATSTSQCDCNLPENGGTGSDTPTQPPYTPTQPPYTPTQPPYTPTQSPSTPTEPANGGQIFNGINLQTGYATTTAEICGRTACGETNSQIATSGLDAFGAIPNVFFKQVGGENYNPQGPYSCHPQWSADGSTVATPGNLIGSDGKAVCYKLTGKDGKSITMKINDTCNGNCSASLIGNQGGCGAQSVSCMDAHDYSKQTDASVRCPPTVYCNAGKSLSAAEVNQALETAYNNNSTIKASPDATGNAAVNISPYAPKPASGYCDWCSGKNMHFDIMSKNCPANVWPTGTVVKYDKITCPS